MPGSGDGSEAVSSPGSGYSLVESPASGPGELLKGAGSRAAQPKGPRVAEGGDEAGGSGSDDSDAFSVDSDVREGNRRVIEGPGAVHAAVAEDKPWRLEPEYCLLYTSPSPRDRTRSRMPSSA